MRPAVFNYLYWGSFILLIVSWILHTDPGIKLSLLLLTGWSLLFFVQGTRYTPVLLRVLMVVALVFSYFLVHLRSTYTSSLLHLIYIAFYLKIRYTNYPLPTCKWAFIFISEAVALAIFFYFLPVIAEVWSVILFMITASIALQSVMHAFRLKEQPAGWYCLAGILFLIAGDALTLGGVSTGILCYGLAHYGLVYGATRYIWQKQGSPYATRRLGTN